MVSDLMYIFIKYSQEFIQLCSHLIYTVLDKALQTTNFHSHGDARNLITSNNNGRLFNP